MRINLKPLSIHVCLIIIITTARNSSVKASIHAHSSKIPAFLVKGQNVISRNSLSWTQTTPYLGSLETRRRVPIIQISLKEDERATIDTSLTQALEFNDLQSIITYLETHTSEISSLTSTQLQSIFDFIEVATIETDENTVNTRILQDTNLISASLDGVRSQMTSIYRLLRDNGRLKVFGAVARVQPSSSQIKAVAKERIIYPTAGSKIITPTLLEEITGIQMINLTPKPTNILVYGGVALAVLEGIVSLYFHINYNLLVLSTILMALADQLFVSGAVFETGLRMIQPDLNSRITKHEAGHFLCAYLLGCPVEGVILSTWAALQDSRFGGRATRAISAGTSYFDIDMNEQISGLKPLIRESIDRYSIIVMSGIAAEALELGRSEGGAGDEEALVRFLKSLNPHGGNAMTWTPELIRNQARWGVTQAILLLKEFKPCYEALVDALERGVNLGGCIVAIEDAAKREGLGMMREPLGTVFDEGDFGKWVSGYHEITVGDESSFNAETTASNREAKGVPTYGKDPITSAESFLEMYHEKMVNEFKEIDEKLTEMDR